MQVPIDVMASMLIAKRGHLHAVNEQEGNIIHLAPADCMLLRFGSQVLCKAAFAPQKKMHKAFGVVKTLIGLQGREHSINNAHFAQDTAIRQVNGVVDFVLRSLRPNEAPTRTAARLMQFARDTVELAGLMNFDVSPQGSTARLAFESKQSTIVILTVGKTVLYVKLLASQPNLAFSTFEAIKTEGLSRI